MRTKDGFSMIENLISVDSATLETLKVKKSGDVGVRHWFHGIVFFNNV